ncbi:MAG: SEC-C metal-binding domain-containing protein [Thermoguttaceae bacterium]|jgi:preprotein translocase subunit SecA
MELLERVFDKFADGMDAFARGVERAVTGVFGSSNARYIRKLQPTIDAINAREAYFQELTDAELRGQTDKFRKRLAAGETLDDLLVDAFAVCREAGRRVLGMRHYDVQLIGGMVLHSGAIAEMVTGEGKTLVATLPAYLNALEGKGVHVVTVNDYLARRDMEWMGPLYMSLGLTVGAIQSNMPNDQRQKAYACNITYGTNNEYGFDYLRDNMRPAARGDSRYPLHLQQVQGPLHYAIIDEVDNILIDEARTPLIISGPARDDVNRYRMADRIARQLRRDAHFEVNEKEHSAHLTDDGVRKAEELAGVESFYTAGNMEWPHLIDNALKAHHLYKRDVNYVVQGEEVVIVDEFTGRLMPGRNWSDGLHQAVEAKEGVRVKEENQTLATITLQNFFKLYDKIAGMTGTAMTEAAEFWKIYKLDVISIPTNRPLWRLNHPDLIYRSEEEKYEAIVEEIERMHKWDTIVKRGGEMLVGTIARENEDSVEIELPRSGSRETVARSAIREIQRKGRPILVGTVSIERSELISGMLDRKGIKHQVLNAKHHQREAEIVAQAGRRGAVTIATNMAGRGTDIILGGNPEALAWALLQEKYPTRLDVPRSEWDGLVAEIEQREHMKVEGREVVANGGLHIIGSERHEARRIDLQLRGRCGRQGDPGSSRFFLSLEDDLMRIFAGEWVKKILTGLGMERGQAIESRMVSRRIEGAQKKVEERNFEIRKNLLEYDEVMDEQRKRVYGYRQQILNGVPCRKLIFEMIDRQINNHLAEFLAKDYGAETFAIWAGKMLSTELEARDYRDMDISLAEQYAKDQAERMAEGQVLEAIEENLPEDADPREWNWEALAKMVNMRWQLGLNSAALKKIGREGLAEFLIEKARAAIHRIDLSEGARFLAHDFGLQTACAWVRHKFGFELDQEEIEGAESSQIAQLIRQRAEAAYRDKEVEFPVMAGLYHFTLRDGSGHKRYDREKLAVWAKDRFGAELSTDDLRNKQRHEIQAVLVEQSRLYAERARQMVEEAQRRVAELYGQHSSPDALPDNARSNGQLRSLAAWMKKELDCEWSEEEMGALRRKDFESRLSELLDDRFRPEMRKMERALVLQLLDSGWKEHLLVMDHLRSSVGLRGYAQVDPKVEYKREGMRLFENMWNAVGERVTDLIFRMEQLDEGFVSSTWTETAAIHEDSSGAATEIARQQQAAIEGTQVDHKHEPIRNRQPRVGRNELCPCGSGKKYKSCCLRKA